MSLDYVLAAPALMTCLVASSFILGRKADSEISSACWGIQNGPGTGKLMSEFVFDGNAVSAKIGALDPRKVL